MLVIINRRLVPRIFDPVHGLLNQICFDPDAFIISALCGTVAASAALRTLDLLGGATDQQPLTDPSGYGGVGRLGFDVADACITL